MHFQKRSVTKLIFPALTFLVAAVCFSALLPPAAACELAIVWRAVMTNQAKTSSAAAAIQFGRLLIDYNLYWYEEPCWPESIDGPRQDRTARQ